MPVAANPPPATSAWLSAPSGLGTAAVRIGHDPGYIERDWGDGSAPPLYCPVVERVNEPLGNEVNERLVAWARNCGFTEEQLDQLREAGLAGWSCWPTRTVTTPTGC